ncbi:MAG: XRE family transcriptional regulator [Actinobacteria bacterium]|nr:XRE family transcriptional regulator [Actinomycetota bacterium]
MIKNENTIKLGIIIKKIRKSKDLTLKDIAGKTGLSKSLISKIENLRTVPSLSVIIKIARALNKNLSELFAEVEVDDRNDYILVRSDKKDPVEREKSKGFNYFSLIITNKSNYVFQSFFVTLDEYTKRSPVTTNGEEFLFILKGSIELLLKNETIVLNKGDSIYFNGRIPHVTRNIFKGKSELLSINLVE